MKLCVLSSWHILEHTPSLEVAGSDLRAQFSGLPEEQVYLCNKDLRASMFSLCLHFSFPLSISVLLLPRLFSLFPFLSPVPMHKSRNCPILAHPETPLQLTSEPYLTGCRSADVRKLAFKRTKLTQQFEPSF